jgi:hypothetical protein
VHPKVVQERLGHANVGITLDIYSHVSPHMQSDAAAKIDAGMRLLWRHLDPEPTKTGPRTSPPGRDDLVRR